MLTTVRGVYRDGKVELEKPPRNIQNDSPVIVTFLDADKMTCGSAAWISLRRACCVPNCPLSLKNG